jgi:dTDP-4-amino-4,6-dideoxygalactose transaminase
LLVAMFDPAKTGMSRDDLLLALRERNIGASIHYRPLHSQPLYAALGSSSLEVTEVMADQILTLPISCKMSLTDVDYVVDCLASLIKKVEVNR